MKPGHKPMAQRVSKKERGTYKLTAARWKAIVDDIAHRVPYEYAAEGNGICEDTLHEWLAQGRRDREQSIDSDYSRFLEDVKKAERNRIREHSDTIAESPERWQSHAWLLERRWHKHYSPNAGLLDLNERMNKVEKGENKDAVGNGEKGKDA